MKAVKVNKLCLIFAAALTATAVGEELQPNIKIFNNLPKKPGTAKGDGKFYKIEQKLDHFNTAETRTWHMRYIGDDQFYKPGGPFFIYVGGEWPISPEYISPGTHIYDMAKENNGYLFYTEHRFYGESKPVKDLTEENLQYLNVQQFMADLAHFIRHQKATVKGAESAKVILVGCSYAGAIVTWFKKKYPDLVTGCWSLSGPVLAKADFGDYKKILGQSIKQLAGDSCYNHIRNGFAEMESMFANKRGIEVKTGLEMCQYFNYENDLDVSSFLFQISESFGNLLQQSKFDEIQKACTTMEKLGDGIGLGKYVIKTFSEGKCIEFSHAGYLNLFKDTQFSEKTMRPWFYQACNEFGWFQTSSSRDQPFGTKYPFDYFAKTCTDAFGDKFTKKFIENQVQNTNKMFGGLNPGVKNVYWTHGELDPWKGVGIQSGNMATILPNHTHCGDLFSIASNDSPELKASKEKIAALVKEWLAK